jgi:hypothetical protein
MAYKNQKKNKIRIKSLRISDGDIKRKHDRAKKRFERKHPPHKMSLEEMEEIIKTL